MIRGSSRSPARVAAAGLLMLAVVASACSGAPKAQEHAPDAAHAFDARLAAEGKLIASANGCVACHSIDGKASVGPTWKGLYDHDVSLADGSTVKADDAYLRESIVKPAAKVVKGYAPGAMPSAFGQALSDAQVNALVEYMKSLH